MDDAAILSFLRENVARAFLFQRPIAIIQPHWLGGHRAW